VSCRLRLLNKKLPMNAVSSWIKTWIIKYDIGSFETFLEHGFWFEILFFLQWYHFGHKFFYICFESCIKIKYHVEILSCLIEFWQSHEADGSSVVEFGVSFDGFCLGEYIESSIVLVLCDIDLCHVEIDSKFELVRLYDDAFLCNFISVHRDCWLFADDSSEM